MQLNPIDSVSNTPLAIYVRLAAFVQDVVFVRQQISLFVWSARLVGYTTAGVSVSDAVASQASKVLDIRPLLRVAHAAALQRRHLFNGDDFSSVRWYAVLFFLT